MSYIMRVCLAIGLLGTMLGCATWDKLDKTEKGAVIGGGGGALIGGATAGTTGALVGGAVGGLAGGVVGHEIEEDDD